MARGTDLPLPRRGVLRPCGGEALGVEHPSARLPRPARFDAPAELPQRCVSGWQRIAQSAKRLTRVGGTADRRSENLG